jgi:DNA-binding NtrC family response regulator
MEALLAIDDEPSIRESYRVIFSGKYRVHVAPDVASAQKALETQHVDLILLDLTLPGKTGMQFLEEWHARGETVPVIVVTASNSVAVAVQAMKFGARDFLIKPFDVETLVNAVDRLMTEARERRELLLLREQIHSTFDNLIGDSPSLRRALALAQQAMNVDSTVLITGETGTGKDVLARAIHFGSKRKTNAFVPLSCCAIPGTLFESELFGHTKGAFTGATENRVGKLQVADGGTLFLDELGEMPLEMQAKFLRVLQEGSFYAVGGTRLITVDVRFICATNRDLAQAITTGAFRADLYYRVNVLPIHLPPLRERREDIPKLIQFFIHKHAGRVNSRVEAFSPRAVARMMSYHWPGNIRELENTVERLLVCFGDTRVIEAEHLDGHLPSTARSVPTEPINEFEGLPLEEATRRLETMLIRRALERCNYVQSHAAEVLGTTRRILKYKMDQLGIVPPNETPESLASNS